MDMKLHWKHSEVGVIPSDWEVQTIGYLNPFVTSGSRGWAAYYSDYGDLFIRITNLDRSSIELDLRDTRYVALPATTHEGARTQLKEGDVLISITADIGIVSYVSSIVSSPAYINQHIALVRFNPEKVFPKFVSYFLASSATQKFFRALSDSGAKAGMNLTTIKQIRLALPPTTVEQEAIAEALSDADALIESLEQLLAKKRCLKQGAMQELLTGKKRLPNFCGEWAVRRLGEICRISTGKKDVGDGNPDGQYPFFTCSRVHTFSDSYSFDTEAILIAGNGDVGNLHYYNGRFEAYQRTYVLSQFNENVGYLWQQLTAYLADSLGLGKIGSSIPYIKKQNLTTFEFRSPKDSAEKAAIAEILSDMDADIAAVEAKLAKARQIKQGMMAELLTGRIRLV